MLPSSLCEELAAVYDDSVGVRTKCGCGHNSRDDPALFDGRCRGCGREMLNKSAVDVIRALLVERDRQVIH